MRSRAHLSSHPLHPMLIPFPFALWTATFVLDALGRLTENAGLWSAGYYALIGGCIGAVLAAVPGVIDLFSVVPPNSSARKRGMLHGLLNSAALLTFIYLGFRRGGASAVPDNTVMLIEAALVGVLMVSGWMGGTLVYRNQIGVDRRYANSGKSKDRVLPGWQHPICNVSELGDGQMMLARVGDERVVVARCGADMIAFSDHCTHRGGPLHDGALIGCTVQCPWHGSQFDIRTGRVVAGPADHRITTYAVRVDNGEVYLADRPKPVTAEPVEGSESSSGPGGKAPAA